MVSKREQQIFGGQICHDLHHPVADLETAAREDVRVTENGIFLVGSRSESSGEIVFPQREFCPVTGARDMVKTAFGPRGILYSFATIHVSSSRPTPYTLGYVDFENGLRVMCHVRTNGAANLSCDQPVEIATDTDGWFVRPTHQERDQ